MYIFSCADCAAVFEKKTRHTCRDGRYRCKKCAQHKADQKHYVKNRKARIENATKWNMENKEQRKATTRRYLESDYGRSIVNAKQKRNYWKNPEYYRLKNSARTYGMSIQTLLGIKQNKCQLCNTYKDITIDHMHPQSRGGVSDKNNLQALCFSCNVWKSDKLFLADGSGYLVGA